MQQRAQDDGLVMILVDISRPDLQITARLISKTPCRRAEVGLARA
jgi:hypothetical protein